MAESLKSLVERPPINAWLLMGDDASYPDPAELAWQRRSWRDTLWTGPKQVQPGDLLLFYFMAPRKAVHFVARAASFPRFDATIEVNAHREVDPNQWWIAHTPLVEVEPLPYKEIAAQFAGHLNLRGKPSHYLPPSIAAALLARTKPLGRPSVRDSQVLQLPVGDPDLPDPDAMTLAQWRHMADGPMRLERQVEQYVVEPLLRLSLSGTTAVTWERGQRIRSGIPDYVIQAAGRAAAVIEVKLGVRTAPRRDGGNSPDYAQAARYADELGVPSMLVDSSRVFLFDKGARQPRTVIERHGATEAHLQQIRSHLLAEP